MKNRAAGSGLSAARAFCGAAPSSTDCAEKRRIMQKAPAAETAGAFQFSQKADLHDVCRAELAVLRVGLGLKRDLLALVERLEAFALDGGEMHENVLAALVVGDEAVALFCVKPFYR